MAIVLIAIGLLFTGVDFMVGSGISYPDFIQPTGLYHGIDIYHEDIFIFSGNTILL